MVIRHFLVNIAHGSLLEIIIYHYVYFICRYQKKNLGNGCSSNRKFTVEKARLEAKISTPSGARDF